jgi:hypothetical protein
MFMAKDSMIRYHDERCGENDPGIKLRPTRNFEPNMTDV